MRAIAALSVIVAIAAIAYKPSANEPLMIATCGDGTESYSEHRRGTCSHHGGVYKWSID